MNAIWALAYCRIRFSNRLRDERNDRAFIGGLNLRWTKSTFGLSSIKFFLVVAVSVYSLVDDRVVFVYMRWTARVFSRGISLRFRFVHCVASYSVLFLRGDGLVGCGGDVCYRSVTDVCYWSATDVCYRSAIDVRINRWAKSFTDH